MRLVYEATQRDVACGHKVRISGVWHVIAFFRAPHKPSSQGKVSVYPYGHPDQSREFYVSVIGARWIEREDRAEGGNVIAFRCAPVQQST